MTALNTVLTSAVPYVDFDAAAELLAVKYATALARTPAPAKQLSLMAAFQRELDAMYARFKLFEARVEGGKEGALNLGYRQTFAAEANAAISDVVGRFNGQTLTKAIDAGDLINTVVIPAVITYDTLAVYEASSNDGRILTSVNIAIDADMFKGRIGTELGAVSGLPGGLSAKIVKVSNTKALLTIAGKATAHASVNSTEAPIISFSGKDFVSGTIAEKSYVAQPLQVKFFDLSLSESFGQIAVSASLAGVAKFDLHSNKIILNGAENFLQSGLMENVTTVNLSGLSGNSLAVEVIGDASANTFVSTDIGATLSGGGGNDVITLARGRETIRFEATPAANGVDTVHNFDTSYTGDVLDFGDFLNQGGTYLAPVLFSSSSAQSWVNGNILLLSGQDIDTTTEIAAAFGPGLPFAAPTTSGKIVVISADVTGDATVWYVINQSAPTAISAAEVTKVATLVGTNSVSLSKLLTRGDAVPMVISYSTARFVEAATNDGRITNSAIIEITGDTFKGALGATLGTVVNLPDGLTAAVTKTSETTAALVFSGKAESNTSADSTNAAVVYFSSADFTSGSVAGKTGVNQALDLKFFDFVLTESSGALSISGDAGDVPVLVDLSRDEILFDEHVNTLSSGSMSNVTSVDLYRLTNVDTVSIVGDSSANTFLMGVGDATVRAGGGNDTVILNAGVETITFESTASTNGLDSIVGFKLGTGGDVLNFSGFLNVTGKTNASVTAPVSASSTGNVVWSNSQVLLVTGEVSTLDSAAEIAALFKSDATDRPFAAPIGSSKTVLIAADIAGDASIWFITNATSTTDISAAEVVQVATLVGINNIGLADNKFLAANFA